MATASVATELDSVAVEAIPALELIQRAEIDQQISTAKKYPRDLARVKRRMLDFATLDEETAESCFYTLERKEADGGKKIIQGPSVRMAEIAVSCYQNLRAACRVVENDGKTITAQGVCHDLENNTLVSVEVKRRITTKSGKTYSEDMQVVAGNAANAIAFRNAVFKVIPGALIRPVYEQAKAVAVGNASTLSTKRAKVIARLNGMQVSTERILHRLEKTSVENIGLEDLEILIGLGTAIRDSETTVDEAFPIGDGEKAQEATDRGTQALKQRLARAKEPSPDHGKLTTVTGAFDTPEWQAAFREASALAVELGEQGLLDAALAEAQTSDDPMIQLGKALDWLRDLKAAKE